MKSTICKKTLFAALAFQLPAAFAGVTLTADGHTDTYQLIQSKLNSTIEAPDCAHPDAGPHITQENDSALGRPAFAFHIHVSPDNDRCQKSDRQRNEIKVDASSPAGLRTVQGESMQYRWLFKLDSKFQASPYFTHVHQIKPVGGDDDMPIISLDPRGGSADALEVGHYDYSNNHRVLKSAPLSGFRGEWVEVKESLTAGRPGKYAITITRLRDKAVLLSYNTGSIDMWRSGNQYLRPKWGIYRSLKNTSYLRDEKVLFNDFCIAKGSETCSGTDTGSSGGTTGGSTGTSGGTSTGTTPPAGTLAALSIPGSAVSASANDGNVPANSVDGSLSTRWSASGDGQWIQYDLQAARTVGQVKIAWYNGASRRSRFEVQLSNDGQAFTTVYNGESSGTTNNAETYDFPDAGARYVRILGHGNSASLWNSISETKVYALQ